MKQRRKLEAQMKKRIREHEKEETKGVDDEGEVPLQAQDSEGVHVENAAYKHKNPKKLKQERLNMFNLTEDS